MSHSYAQNHIHLVFSSKNREKVFARDFLPRLWAYTAGICKHHDLLTFAVGGMEDHMHLLFRLPPTMTLANAVSLVKSNSSSWIKEQRKSFAWQEGYGAFSVSSSQISTVIKYIDNQEAHHRKIGFETSSFLIEKAQNTVRSEIRIRVVSPPTGLASLGAIVSQSFRTWARLVRALRRWSVRDRP